MTLDGVITHKKCILWETLQFDLRQVSTSLHLEFQPCGVKLHLPSKKGQTSQKDVASLVVQLVKSGKKYLLKDLIEIYRLVNKGFNKMKCSNVTLKIVWFSISIDSPSYVSSSSTRHINQTTKSHPRQVSFELD